ncbi:MAG TPA: indole-3-glycerol phosphate synthase TrpC [Solirubrobacterales bacterium]|nr:indole-3-glycerol phosphate synthase TrpC [Solirubrobacterales bacterium]
MSRLDQLLTSTREDVARRRSEVPASELRAQLGTRTGSRPFKEALTRSGLSLIAEFKRGSPSAGEILPGATVPDVVGAYERGGAAALSVLTEPHQFLGSLDDLRAAKAASGLPVLRKDFIVDPYQLWESAAAAADAVLLIVAALDDDDLRTLYAETVQLDLDCVVEVHDGEDLERALAIDPEVIGINNRNLRSFETDIQTTHELCSDIPAGKTIVSESGYGRRDQLDDLERIGVDAVLIGETLMRADDPEAMVRELTLDEELTREHLLDDR